MVDNNKSGAETASTTTKPVGTVDPVTTDDTVAEKYTDLQLSALAGEDVTSYGPSPQNVYADTFKDQSGLPGTFTSEGPTGAIPGFNPPPEGYEPKPPQASKVDPQPTGDLVYQWNPNPSGYLDLTPDGFLDLEPPELNFSPPGAQTGVDRGRPNAVSQAISLINRGKIPAAYTAYQELTGDAAIGVDGYGSLNAAGGIAQYTSMYVDLLNAFNDGSEPLMHIPNNVVGHPDFPYSAMDLLEAGYAPDPNGGAFWGYALNTGGGGGGDGGYTSGSGSGGWPVGGYGGSGGYGNPYDYTIGLLINWRGVGFS